MNIFVAYWSLGITILFSTGTLCETDRSAKANTMKPVDFSSLFIPPIKNGSPEAAHDLQVQNPQPSNTERHSRDILERSWLDPTVGGNGGESLKENHFIQPDRNWLRSIEQNAVLGTKYSKLFLPNVRLKSQSVKDKNHTGRSKKHVPRKRNKHVLHHNPVLPVVACEEHSSSEICVQSHLDLNSKQAGHVFHVHQSESACGETKEHLVHKLEQIRNNLLISPQTLETAGGTLETVADELLGKPERAAKSLEASTAILMTTLLPNFHMRVVNKFPSSASRVIQRPPRKRSDTYLVENRENHPLDNFQEDQKGTEDQSLERSGNDQNPWSSELEIDEINRYKIPLVTSGMTSTYTSFASGESTDEETREELVNRFDVTHPVKVWKALGLYDNSFLTSVHSHWLEFEPASSTTHGVLGVIYSLIMVIGIGGNFLVILMFVRCRSLRTPPNFLIVNLAVSDCLMMIKMPIFIFNSIYDGPALGSIGCNIYGFVGGLSGTASIMTLSAIALDRYTVIAYPINPMKKTTTSRAMWMITAVWLYSIFFSSLPFFGVSGYVAEGYLTSCSFDYLSSNTSDRLFIFIFFLGAFVFPLSLIVFSYVKIFQTVNSAEKSEVFNPKRSGTASHCRESFRCKHDSNKQKTEVKIAVLSCTLIVVWLVAWTPYSVVSLLGILGYQDLITPLGSAIPALFCKTAGCIDPFLYAINHPRFQRELRAKLPFVAWRLKRSGSRSSAASYYSNTQNLTDFSYNRRTSSPSTSFDTSRYKTSGNSSLHVSPNLRFDMREVSPVHASSNTTCSPGTPRNLKPSLKRPKGYMRNGVLETSEGKCKPGGDLVPCPESPDPNETTIHLLCGDTIDEQNHRYNVQWSGDDQEDSTCELQITNKQHPGATEAHEKCKYSLLGDCDMDKTTTNGNSTKVMIHDDERSNDYGLQSHDGMSFCNRHIDSQAGESLEENPPVPSKSSTCTLIVRTETKRRGFCPYVAYETTIL